jgi:hypothetical protein
MKRPVYAGDGQGPGKLNDEASGHLKKLAPALWEFLTHDAYEDGEKRETGTMLVMKDDGVLKGWLNDRDNLKTCWVSGDSWDGLLRAAEKVLGDPGAIWKDAKAYDRKKGGRGK